MSRFMSFLRAVNSEITSGSQFLWDCYGPAWSLIAVNDRASCDIIFSPATTEVYEVRVTSGLGSGHYYRWVNPRYLEAAKAEHERRSYGWSEVDNEGAVWADTDSFEDILEKAEAIRNGRTFDKRVTLNLELEEDLILKLALMAHERDITLNELLVEILTRAAREVVT